MSTARELKTNVGNAVLRTERGKTIRANQSSDLKNTDHQKKQNLREANPRND
jgi:hypothetical protein